MKPRMGSYWIYSICPYSVESSHNDQYTQTVVWWSVSSSTRVTVTQGKFSFKLLCVAAIFPHRNTNWYFTVRWMYMVAPFPFTKWWLIVWLNLHLLEMMLETGHKEYWGCGLWGCKCYTRIYEYTHSRTETHRLVAFVPSTHDGLALVVPATCPGKQEHLTVWERSSILFLLQQRWTATTSHVPCFTWYETEKEKERKERIRGLFA